MTQPTLEQWLKRGRTPKKRKRLNPVSKKRGAAMKEYAKKRKAFLRAHPYCQGKRQMGVCSENHVGPVVHDCFNRPRDVHHVRGRGKYLLDESTWLAVCRGCHDWIHSHPLTARTLGLLS